MHSDHSAGDLVRCPACTEPTASLKRYTIVKLLVFVFVFAYTQRMTVTSCPPCMRKTILTQTLINIIPANLLWVIIVLPWHTVQLCRTWTEGHSSDIRQML
jgi:hypothetical protein